MFRRHSHTTNKPTTEQPHVVCVGWLALVCGVALFFAGLCRLIACYQAHMRQRSSTDRTLSTDNARIMLLTVNLIDVK